jgi:hypothetical protein
MKKGQLEIGVTVMVLFVFFILLAITLIFYFQSMSGSFLEEKGEILGFRYSGLLSVVANMPEFKCSKNAIEDECLDEIKLKAFRDLKDSDYDVGSLTINPILKQHYNELFSGINAIYVNKVYPNTDEWELYGDKDKEGRIYAMPISLYDPVEDKFSIGILRIKVEL